MSIWAYNKLCIQLAGILSSWQNNVNIILMSENSSDVVKNIFAKNARMFFVK